MASIQAILIALCLNAAACAAPFNIERYVDFSGPLMESLGPTAISHASWKTVQRINIKEIVDAPQLLQQILEKLQRNCNDTCSYAYKIQLAAMHLNETTRVIQGLRSTLEQYTDRSKRSLIPIIGRVANLLFGTLDDLAEERIQLLIETSANDTRKLAALLANQTEIVDRRLEMMETDILNLKNDVFNILDERNYDEVITELQTQIALVRTDAETLLEAILFARTGIIHPRLLPTTLIENTATLMRVIKANNNVQVDKNDIFELLKIAKIIILYKAPFLIYYIVTPLTSSSRYNLIKFTAVPFNININDFYNFAYVWPNSQYALINDDLTSYITITNTKLSKCKKLRDYHICSNTDPVQIIHETSPCEVRLFAGERSNIETFCDIRSTSLKDTFWTRFHKQNKWLFSAPKSENIFIQCEHYSTATTISNVGTLHLQQGCSARTSNTILEASYEYLLNANSSSLAYTGINITRLTSAPLFAQNLTQRSLNQMHDFKGIYDELGNGQKLNDIIISARQLTEYTPLVEKPGYSSWDYLYNIIIIGGAILIILLSILAGLRVLNSLRLITGRNIYSSRRNLQQNINSGSVEFNLERIGATSRRTTAH